MLMTDTRGLLGYDGDGRSASRTNRTRFGHCTGRIAAVPHPDRVTPDPAVLAAEAAEVRAFVRLLDLD